MHLSARGGGGRDEGLAETEHEVSLGEPQSPERKVTKAKYHLGLFADNLQLFKDRKTLGVRHDTVERGDILASV